MLYEELKKKGNFIAEVDLHNNGIYTGTDYIYEYLGNIFVSSRYANQLQYTGKNDTVEYTKESFIGNFYGMSIYEDAVEKVAGLLKEDLISLAEYAELQGVHQDTVRQKILRGNLKAKKIGRNWVIDKNEPYIDNRKKDK
jgi:excisionase family DNA binding protein